MTQAHFRRSFDHITSANIPLSKVCHMAKPNMAAVRILCGGQRCVNIYGIIIKLSQPSTLQLA